jgi:GT2 family glycosyltransferase
MLPKVAIIYLSYNSKKYFDEVFLSLDKINYPKDRLEIIFVDNVSTDGSREYLSKVDGITYFPNDENTGFAEGNNLAIRYAIDKGTDYVYLHNPDLILTPDALKEAVEMAQSDEQIGSVQSFMKLWKHKDTINSTGGMIHFLGFGYVSENGTKAQETKAVDGQEINYASGAAVLYKTSILKKVGLLDSYLWLYHEDLELGWRIRLAGYKNVLAKKSIVFHDYEFSRSITKFYWMERNRFLVHFSHLKTPTLILLLPFFIIMEIALIPFALKGGWAKEKLSTYWNLIQPKTFFYLAKKRRQSKKLRKVTDKKIISLFTAKIEHQETSNPVVDKIGNPLLSFVWFLIKKIITW